MTKIAGSGSESGSIRQRHGFADPDPDPDPRQNVTDLQHWLKGVSRKLYWAFDDINGKLSA
jgi:hypothetical protein